MRIAWFARCPTPYRYPIWDEVSRRHDLSIHFLQAQGIGRPWEIRASSSYRQVVLPAVGVPYREDALWILRMGWGARLPRSVDVCVLQGMWETPAAWQIKRWATRRSIPLLYFSESTISSMHHIEGPIAALRARFMRCMDGFITPGPAASVALMRYGAPPDKITTSVNVVDVQAYREGALLRRAAAGTTNGDAVHRYLVVARLLPRKNVSAAIDALACLESSTMDIVGDGPEREGLERRASEVGVASRVRFHGELDQNGVMEALAGCHTLVLPSLEEVWGLVVNEALAAGLHVVVSARAGVADTVAGQKGVYISAPDAGHLASAMRDSAQGWRGWNPCPEILGHDAARFTKDLTRALTDVSTGANGRRHRV